MKIRLLFALLIAALPFGAILGAPEPTASASPTPPSYTASMAVPATTPDPTGDLDRDLRDREAKILQLTIEEQLRLRAAQQKAADDPAVKEAFEKRNRAVAEFRAKFHEAMIKTDPSIEPLLNRIAVGSSPGF